MYDAWEGLDMTPWIKFPRQTLTSYKARDGNSSMLLPFHFTNHSTEMTYNFCQILNSDQSTWNVQRVGPFSLANISAWWQMSGRDAFELSAAISEHKNIALVEYSVGPFDYAGNMISALDLHVHHVHLTKASAFPLNVPVPALYIDLADHNVKVYEHHNEIDPCKGGSLCYTESEPPGFARFVDSALDLDLELVVDRMHAPFFLQFAVRWFSSEASLTPVSFLPMVVYNAGLEETMGFYLARQSTWQEYQWVPTTSRLIWLSSSKIPARYQHAKVLYVKPHMHIGMIYKSLLFACNISRLGISSYLNSFALHKYVYRLEETEFEHLKQAAEVAEQHGKEWLICSVSQQMRSGRVIASPGGDINCFAEWYLTTLDWTVLTLTELQTEYNKPEFPLHLAWFLAIATPGCSIYGGRATYFVPGSPGGCISLSQNIESEQRYGAFLRPFFLMFAMSVSAATMHAISYAKKSDGVLLMT